MARISRRRNKKADDKSTTTPTNPENEGGTPSDVTNTATETNAAVELREKARIEYGIANADDLTDEQINAEIKAIDKQAADAEKERKAQDSDSDS